MDDDINIFNIAELAQTLLSVMNEIGDDMASSVAPEETKEITLFHSKGAGLACLACVA